MDFIFGQVSKTIDSFSNCLFFISKSYTQGTPTSRFFVLLLHRAREAVGLNNVS